MRRRPDRLPTASPARRTDRRHADRLRALLREDPFSAASTASTMAGRRPSSAPAASTIPSSRSRCPSRRSPAPACLPAPALGRTSTRCAGGRARRNHHRKRLVVGARDLSRRIRMDRRWAQRGFLQRTDQQFHWENHGYATFDDFLGALASRKRKAMRRERKEGAQPRHRGALADRRRSTEDIMGCVLRVLHGHRLAQMGNGPT